MVDLEFRTSLVWLAHHCAGLWCSMGPIEGVDPCADRIVWRLCLFVHVSRDFLICFIALSQPDDSDGWDTHTDRNVTHREVTLRTSTQMRTRLQ